MSKIIKYGVPGLILLTAVGYVLDDKKPDARTAANVSQPKPAPKPEPEPQEPEQPAAPAPPPLRAGDTVRLVYAGHEDLRVPAAVSWEIYKQLENVLAIGDDVGLRELASSHSVTFLEPGTEALLLRKGILGSQVRIISHGRPSDGKAMWVQASHVMLRELPAAAN